MREMEEAFPRFRHMEDALVFTVCKIVGVDRGGVAVAEVDPAAFLLRYPRGERHAHARDLSPVLVGPDAVDVRRMGEDAPGVILEALPLFQEVVAAVVADLPDQPPVHLGNLAEVRRIDDELAAVRHDRLQFIHALPGDPELVIHRWRARQDGVERTVLAGDMDLGRKVAGGIPGRFRRPREKPGEPPVVDHGGEAEAILPDKRGGAIHHLADGRPFVADDHRVGDDRPEPVEKIEDLRAPDTGEEVFVAAGKTDHLVRENRPDDDQGVISTDPAVDLHGHGHGKKAAGQLVDLSGRDAPDLLKARGIIPGVVEHPHVAVSPGPLFRGDLQPPIDRLPAHGGMGAEGDHDIQPGDRPVETGVQALEERADRGRARPVRDDQQDPLAGEGIAADEAVQHGCDLRRVERVPVGSLCGEGGHRSRSSATDSPRPPADPCR